MEEVDAVVHASFTSIPWNKASTYCFVTASKSLTGTVANVNNPDMMPPVKLNLVTPNSTTAFCKSLAVTPPPGVNVISSAWCECAVGGLALVNLKSVSLITHARAESDEGVTNVTAPKSVVFAGGKSSIVPVGPTGPTPPNPCSKITVSILSTRAIGTCLFG